MSFKIFLLIFVITFTNVSSIDQLNSTASSTTNNVPNITSTTAESVLRSHTKDKYLDSIFEKLNAEKANKCEYGNDPKISELCPELFTRKTDFNEIKLSDIEKIVINKTVIELLRHKCINGHWCLNEVDLKPFAVQIAQSSLELCLYAACHRSMSDYVRKCVSSDIAKGILNIVPTLCDLNTNGKSKQYCLESSMRLIHLSIPGGYDFNSNKSSVNECEKDLSRGWCQGSCKSYALEMNKLESCCQNTTLVTKFNHLNWYTVYGEIVEKKCSLPITGVCFSEKFIGISPNILIISIVITVMTMVLVFLTIYAVCCKKHIKAQPYTETYEYAQLNQEVEEEMNMNRVSLSDDEYGCVIKNNRIDLDDNRNISRFVNQHQTDIKSLLN